eukprot:gene18943-6298_t
MNATIVNTTRLQPLTRLGPSMLVSMLTMLAGMGGYGIPGTFEQRKDFEGPWYVTWTTFVLLCMTDEVGWVRVSEIYPLYCEGVDIVIAQRYGS